ncbi:hypothetical protein [Labedaea rhizosphaerae]|uniref:hypothetical protein n=1 Tax=Labedaea rhizosphaerae TaxID=598644 RepID=UPI00105FDADC|nr:hypothetical protein [Labedaea rhizosphaerae]
MRVLLRLAVVVALLGLTPVPAAAEPAPPKFDVGAAIAALGHQPIYVAPGSVARIDLDAVRGTMGPASRLLVMPWRSKEMSGDQFYKDIYTPLDDWATKNHLELTYVEGIQVSNGAVTTGPTSLADLREQTAYHEVTGPVLGSMAWFKNHNAPIPYPPYQVMAPTAAQLDALTAKLRANPIYNAPGVDDPLVQFTPDLFATARKAVGHDLRVAALPLLTPGEPFVDYAPALAKRFPGSVVMVGQGDWLEVKGPNQALLTSARDYAYGRYQYSSFTDGMVMADRMSTVAGRYFELTQRKPFGRPQPASQPKPVPYDVRRTISNAAPWALLGAAIVLTGSGLVFRRLRTARADAEEKTAMRRERARTFARIGDLDAKLLAVEDAGGRVDPAVAERQSTAHTLYGQALTAAAMREVGKVADEGLHMLVETADR